MARKSIPLTVGILLFVLSILTPSILATSEKPPPVYKDPSKPIEDRIKDLLSKMTLEEKIGQMTQIDREKATPEVMKKYSIGSVLNGGGSAPKLNATAKEWLKVINDVQYSALSNRLGIPMIYGIDAVHGHNNVYNSTIFPHNVGLGATRDADLVKRVAAATALEVRATGIPYTFAPCIAVCRDPRWGRCYESFSEDPKVVSQLGTAAILGLQGDPTKGKDSYPFVAGKTKVAACAKHFVGDGGTVNGINENNTKTSMDELLKIHMPGYLPAVKQGVATVMASYSSFNGVKMHANKKLLTDYLKNQLKFQGFVISDWQGIDKITDPPHKNYTYSIETSINAGIDMVMVPFNYTEFISILTDLVKKKVVPESRIDDAVTRILRVKFTMGIFEDPVGDDSFMSKFGGKEHRDVAREAVRKSLVLLKNGKKGEKPLLPLPKKADKILVAGTHADNLGYQCGGWTITWQGGSGNNYTCGTTILAGINKTVDSTTKVEFKENPDSKAVKSGKYSYAIVVTGEHPYAETIGDSNNLTIPDPGPSTIKNVCGAVKCVVVIISGRPVIIDPFLDDMDAVVAAWLPGTEGDGVAEVLFGDYGFSGKLGMTWLKNVKQLPMNNGDKGYDPLFKFDYGLTTDGGNDKAQAPSSPKAQPPSSPSSSKAPKAQAPSPPSTKGQAPSPKAKAPSSSPKAEAPSPKAKAPSSPKAKAPSSSPKAEAPSSSSSKANAPSSPKAKAPSPK